MRYYKYVESGYIKGIGIGYGYTEISADEYQEIMQTIRSRPTPPEGKGYRLKEDLNWEEYDKPVIPDTDPELTDWQALNIILGGEA